MRTTTARRGAMALTIALSFTLLGAGCAGGPRGVPRMADADRIRETPAAKEAAQLAPQAFARAEAEREQARKSESDGDDVAAALYADRAVAAYGHAFVLARLARATRENEEAQALLATASQRARELAASRVQVDAEGEELEKQLAVAREATPVTPSGPADAKREVARLVAARALATEARLLCGSARLVGAEAAALGDAEKELADLEAQLESRPHPAPIDAAARARAKCLDRLTTARRTSSNAPSAVRADALLAELSASGGLDPSRDERGVVVALRDLFDGASLAPRGQAKLGDLGRVAAAHPGLGVQVVVHDAAAPSKAEAALDAQRADAVVKALVAAGAPAERVKGEAVGARAPIVDPGDAGHRGRNARVEVVFVTR